MPDVCTPYFVTYPHQQGTIYAWCCSTTSKNYFTLYPLYGLDVGLSFPSKRKRYLLDIMLSKGTAASGIGQNKCQRGGQDILTRKEHNFTGGFVHSEI
jgi:hypothetical protein